MAGDDEPENSTPEVSGSGNAASLSAFGGMLKTHRAPPPLKLELQPYLMWKKDVEIWQLLTSMSQEKQGLDLYMSLEQKYKQFVNLSVAELSQATGIKKILEKLDELLLKDTDTLAYEAYEKFDTFRKVGNMSMVEYINKFDQLYNKAAEYDLTMGTGVLAYLLLKGASLSDSDIKMVRLSLKKLDYSSMKRQLLSVSANFASSSSSEHSVGPSLILPPDKKIKTEDFDFSDEAHWNWNNSSRGRGGYSQRGSYRGNSSRGRGNNYGNRGRGRGRGGSARQNPIDPVTGHPRKCFICDETDHLARDCTNSKSSTNNYTVIKDEEKAEEAHMVITLMEVNESKESEASEKSDIYETFLCESDSTAILDTACTRTVCGEPWLDLYLDTLTEEELSNVEYSDTSRKYKFGSGDPVEATKAVTFPCSIAGVDVKLKANIVSSRVPLLLSKESMKKAKMVLDIGNDTAKVFGKTIHLDETSSGHYCISLSKAMDKLKKFNKSLGENNSEISLYCTVPLQQQDEKQLKASALKLHRQFGHSPSARLRKLVISAGEGSEKLLKALDDVAENCETCKRYKRVPPRPVVSIPIGQKFLDVVAMDLKHIRDNSWVLHLIDSFTRFSGGTIIYNKRPETIIKGILECWVKFLGVPRKILTDNGGEFVNQDFMDMADNLNIHVMTTPAEAPWCNGICEKHNHIIGGMLDKLWEEGQRDLKQNLSWCLNAKNSMENNNGFTPYQLAIGTNPILPNNLNSKLPALEGVTTSEVISEQLKLMHESRKAFTHAESSERLRRALRSNVRTYTENEINVGESVYFKRKDSDRWRGPAKVVGTDGKNLILKHGGFIVTVHLCRVVTVSDAEDMANEVVQESTTVEYNNNVTPNHTGETTITPIAVPAIDSEPQDSAELSATVQASEVQHSTTDPPDTIGENQAVQPTANEDVRDGTTLPLNESRVKYKLNDDLEWTVADIIGRAGKATGKNRNWINIHTDNHDYSIDWEKVEAWTPFDEVAYIADCPDLTAAKETELNRWRNNDVFNVIPDNGEIAIETRWVLTEKILANGTFGTKARLVAKGFQDPSKSNIRSDSPTALKTSLRLATTFIVSQGWAVRSFDISAAFLQGEKIDRKVILRPPPEANCKGLWSLNKSVYGLDDASRKFYLKVKKELLSMKMEQSKSDPALFFKRQNGKTTGIVSTHVDDFFYGGIEAFCDILMRKIKSVFLLSSESCQTFKYVGFNVVQHEDKVVYDQKDYLKNLKPIEINKNREIMKDEHLTQQEQGEMKRRCGQLNWLSTHTRPDISFDLAELSGRTGSLRVNDITRMNKLINKVKSNDVYLTFPCLEDSNNLKIAVYADASLANLPDGGSQAGYLVFLVDRFGRAALIDWKSYKIRRVVRSTLAAETLAMADAVDAAAFVAATWKELVGPNWNNAAEVITDCRSLYENVNSTKLCNEKRLRIDIAMLKQMQERNEIYLRWTESEHQLADVLTKKGVCGMNLSRVITTGHL